MGHPVWVRGDVTLADERSLLRARAVPARQFVELRTLYPRDAFPSTAGMRVSEGEGLAKIVAEEQADVPPADFRPFILARAVLGTLICAALICVAAPLVGAVILRLCGAARWSWLAPSVGISALMLGAVPALHTPGRSFTVAVLLAVGVAAALVAAVLRPELRPPPVGVLAAAPVGLLALVPFAANGHAGTLGVSFNNDMATHLALAEAYRSESIARVLHVDPSYPIGPHALVGAVAQGLGIGVEEAFAGLTIAIPVLLAWTALAALERTSWLGQVFVATLVGMPFLVAGYYGQGSFKELLQSVFVVAFAIALQRQADLRGRLRWIPPALLSAGVLSVYSSPGIVWLAAFLGLWVAGLAVENLWRRRPSSDVLAGIHAEAGPIAIAAVALAVLLVPQGPRLARFVSPRVETNLTGIPTEGPDALGNLPGRLPFWEAFGAWDNPDYRLPPIDPFVTGMWTALVAGLVLAGAAWWLGRGEWLVPAAAAASVGIWLYSDRHYAPYVAAKGLVILTPLLMLLAARAVAEFDAARWRPWWRFGAGAVVVVLTIKLAGASWDALRYARVGPRAHLQELRELRPLLDRRPTLFLGNDDFIRWELAGVPVSAPVIGFQSLSTRPEKPWTYGAPFDFDSLDPATLNEYEWILAPRDAAGSAPPEALRLTKRTRSFALWRRIAPIQPRSLLTEGAAAGALLDCSTPSNRQLRRNGGTAAVRKATISVPVPPLPPGAGHEVRLSLGAGVWELQAPYESQHAIEITAPGLRTTLPANLDRPGPRWRIGQLHLPKPATITMRVRVKEGLLEGEGHVAYLNAILATPEAPPRLVPLREACGRLVDWFRPRAS
jgi:hypothetical protein